MISLGLCGISFLKSKYEIHGVFSQFMNMVEHNFDVIIKEVQSYEGKEFHFLSSFLASMGIVRRKSFPHTSEKNKVVDTRDRRVFKLGLSVVFEAGMHMRFWVYELQFTH